MGLLKRYVRQISIHAPARGATRQAREHIAQARNFNPRSREGSDIFLSKDFVDNLKFQSTLPRGERREHRHRKGFGDRNFNPRSREGSDKPTLGSEFKSYTISIHAPARGATTVFLIHKISNINFNPRSREGSDPISPYTIYWWYNFNPRSREGSDVVCDGTSNGYGNFNPRSREGSDSWRRYAVIVSGWISIHAPARGATYL